MFRRKFADRTYQAVFVHLRVTWHLIGHLLGAGLIFIVFVLISWVVNTALSFLQLTVPFPAEVFVYITKFELYLIYGDSVICAIVFICGACRVVLEVLGGAK